MYFFWKRKTGFGIVMKNCAGCGILVKKERECGIRTPLPDPVCFPCLPASDSLSLNHAALLLLLFNWKLSRSDFKNLLNFLKSCSLQGTMKVPLCFFGN